MAGRLYGVDGISYGLAIVEDWYWKPLPQWAKVFMARLDAFYPRSLTGYEVFVILADVESALMPRRRERCAVYVERVG